MKKHITFLSLWIFICSSSIACANYLVVTSDQVMVTSEGMYVTVDGSPIEVESLSAANSGYLVAIPSPKADICPKCGCKKYVRGRFCPVCGFPDDAKKAVNKNALGG